MNSIKSKSIRLSERDKKIIASNSNICTDLHGRGCDNLQNSQIDNKKN